MHASTYRKYRCQLPARSACRPACNPSDDHRRTRLSNYDRRNAFSLTLSRNIATPGLPSTSFLARADHGVRTRSSTERSRVSVALNALGIELSSASCLAFSFVLLPFNSVYELGSLNEETGSCRVLG